MSEITNILSKELGTGLEENVPLANFSSLKVGGNADFFYRAKDIASLTLAVSLACRNNLAFFILGGGYNIVPSDQGFRGLVIKNESNNIVFSSESSKVIVDSGVNLGSLINAAAGRDLGGLEFLFGVPGTVGGAVYGNAGAFNYEIGNFVKSVTLLTLKDGNCAIVRHDSEWMRFGYRSSILKKEKDSFKPVILTVTLQLVQRRRDEILRMMQENIAKKKLSQPLGEFSAGSFFKNAGIGKELAAGYLLDQAGAKKMRQGGAAFSQKHANFLINKKNATASDVRELAQKAREVVIQKSNIELAEEVEYIGQW
ncbi:MAG: UDP-N-acetylmuramate dehydrogenase [Candidatus Berkelbacteria bacterium]|nr:UDP-N-acetylmuramate dehydrogenase [Candidatus Berkelbacteria bacterium]